MLFCIKQGLVIARLMCKQQLQLSQIKPLVIIDVFFLMIGWPCIAV